MVLSEYIGLFLYFGLMLLAGGAMILLSHLLQIRVKGEKYDWTKPYECGLRSEGLRMDRYPVHYYLVGILFVIFDVEIIFFVPWAVVGGDFREAGLALFWFVEMLVFLFILLVGYVYLLKRGVFNWGGEYD